MSANDVMIDFAVASALILFAQFLRAKVKFLQEFFIPASMLAGLMGVVLGKNYLNILPLSSSFSSHTWVLIILIFAVIGINGFDLSGRTKGSAVGKGSAFERIHNFGLYKIFTMTVQFTFPIAIFKFVAPKLWPDINPIFPMLMPAGFVGGHGTAAAVGAVAKDYGWEEGLDIGMTFASVGLLIGIFGGVALIKWATKKNATAYIKDFRYISGDLRTGLIAKENRVPMGYDTISSVSLDSLCFNLSIVLVVSAAAYLFNNKFFAAHVVSGIPDYTWGFVFGLIFFYAFRKTPVYNYVDKRVMGRISGTCTDYLVFFGVSSINLGVVVEYAAPLLLMIACGIVCVLLCVFPFGYLMNGKSWFERAMLQYGTCSGVLAIGMCLLRVVDPDNKSKCLEDTAAFPWDSLIGPFYWAAFPAMLMFGQGWTVVLISVAICAACLIIPAVLRWYHTEPKFGRGGWDGTEEMTVENAK